MAKGDPRIRFLGYVGDEEMLSLYADALVVPSIPIAEDYGYVAVEAMKSKKPVITCNDSGEALAFVKDGETGFVVAPDARAIAEKISLLIAEKHLAREMGERARTATDHIRWESVVKKLVDENEKDAMVASKKHKGRIMVTDNQMLTPAVGGGRIRILYLYKDLPPEYTVTYVGAHDHPGPEYRELQVTENFLEIVVPLTQIHFKIESFLRRLAGNKVVMDVTIPLLMRFSPRFMDKADKYAATAKIVIVAHPWVFPWIKCSDDQLLVYDSQNCEYLVKKQILNNTLAGKWLVRLVRNVERRICLEADLILACSEEDKASFVNLYGVAEDKIAVVPNGVSVSEIKPAGASAARGAKDALKLNDKAVVLFIGSGYGPNTEGLSFIVDNLASELRDCLFVVMGSVKDSYLQETGKAEEDLPPNVRLCGILDPQERNELYAASDIAINPMFRGSGTNIKMLDYFAAGLPVVSTPVGARGIEMGNGAHGIICEPDEFVCHIDKLAKSGERRLEFGANARKLAEEKYDWKVIAGDMLRRLDEAAEKKRLGRL
jgi:glycosyltransferase involved in cell wall biosynthesis